MTLQWLQVFTWGTVSTAVASAVALAATAPTSGPAPGVVVARAASAAAVPRDALLRTAARPPLSTMASTAP